MALHRISPLSRMKPLKFKTFTTLTSSESQPSSSSSDSDTFLVDKICFCLKQGTNLRNHLIQLNPITVVDILYRCRNDLTLGQKFLDQLGYNVPNFKHSSLSLSAMIHILVRSGRLSDAQGCVLRMIRRSGVRKEEIVDSLVESYNKCDSNDSVFDLLIRTYVQARKLREGYEAFMLLRSRGYVVGIDACNALIGSLVRIGWLELAWEVYYKCGVGVNVYTLNIMVNALCKDGKVARVGGFLKEGEEKGVYPDVVTYNTLISAYSSKDL